jgi:hypothetical protein
MGSTLDEVWWSCRRSDERKNVMALRLYDGLYEQWLELAAAERKSSAARRMSLVDRNGVRAHLLHKTTPTPAGRLQRGVAGDVLLAIIRRDINLPRSHGHL